MRPIVVDLFGVPARTVLALSALTVARAVTYWLIRDRDAESIRQSS
jgi:hypothetical protein